MTGLGLQIMPAPVGQGYSLRSTQDILAEKGQMGVPRREKVVQRREKVVQHGGDAPRF